MNKEQQLHKLASSANSGKSADLFDSVIGMVDTLIQDGKLHQLNAIIKRAFPEYFAENDSLTDYIIGDVVITESCYWGEIVEITKHEDGYNLYKVQNNYPEEGCYMILNRDQFHLINPELQKCKELPF